MKYFKCIKGNNGEEKEFEITREDAIRILRNNYSGEKTLHEILKSEQAIPCPFGYIRTSVQ